MDKKQQTIQTYNSSARQLADKFNALDVRVKDIEETVHLVNKKNPFILEIGCGNGRDAAEILKHTDRYIGIDISEHLLEIAREQVPRGQFVVADIESYDFPAGIDIVFAFASLIHVPRESFKNIMERIFAVLNEGGVIRLFMKYSDVYAEVTKEDKFGIRTYYHYSKEDVIELTSRFSLLKNELVEFVGQNWLEILLQKSTDI